MKNSLKILSVVTILGLGAQAAQADLVLYLDDMSTAGIDVIVEDQGAIGTDDDASFVGASTHPDGNIAMGIVSFSGTVGSFDVNITTGLSKPIVGGPNNNVLHLDSVHVSGSAGTIKIGLTDTSFLNAALPGVLQADFGGVSGGTVSMAYGVDVANAEFSGGGALPFGLGPFPAGSFSASATHPGIPASGPFSLSEIVTVTHAGSGMRTTSFDAELSVVPAPGAALLAMMGMGMVGWARRRLS